MVEMAYDLLYTHDNHTTAIYLIDAQLEKTNSQVTFDREQDRQEMIRVLHAARVNSGNRKILDLEVLVNQTGGVFNPDKEAPEDDDALQAALSAQIHKTNYENRGADAHDTNGPM